MQRDFPIGTVQSWSGAIVDIPSTWRLCDGTHGTPDLRDRFIVGAGTTYSPADVGGSVLHTHDFTGDGHTHNLLAGVPIIAGTDLDFNTDSQPATGTTGNEDGRPAFYALAYIMYAGVAI